MNNLNAKIVVIIAAGMGSRIQSESGLPKPLLVLNGRSLILRVLDSFKEAGINEAIIVVGHRADEVKAGVNKGLPSDMKVQFVYNPNYKMNNGLSVLSAKEKVGNRPFFLSMADHVFDVSLIKGLAKAAIPKDGVVLAVDRKLDCIYDEDDATKVKTIDDKIVEIHKELTEFDAVDTGLFACTKMLFTNIIKASKTRQNGDCTLSDGIKAMSANGSAVVYDIGDGRWQDVDTLGAAKHAENIF